MKSATAAVLTTTLLAWAIPAAAHAQGVPDVPDVPKLPNKPLTPKLPAPVTPPGDPENSADDLVRVRGVADVSLLAPGQTLNLAFIFEIEPGWHIYWKNSGSSGAPTSVKISGPPTFAIGEVRFPRPQVIEEPEGVVYGYEDKAVLFVEITAPPTLPSSSATFTAEINFLVCKEICLMGRVMEMVTVGAGSLAPSGEEPGGTEPDGGPLKSFKARLPRPLADATGQEISFDGSNVTIKLARQGHETAQLIPESRPGVEIGQANVVVEGDKIVITAPVTVKPQNTRGQRPMIAGLIGLGTDAEGPSFEFEIPAEWP